MPLTRELEIKAKDDIYLALNKLIDRYLREGTSLPDLIRHFKIKNNFNTLLKDISYAGRRFFNEDENYPSVIKEVLNEILTERIAEKETINLTERTIINYSMFDKISESVKISDVSMDYMFNDLSFSEEEKNILASFFNTKPELVVLKNSKYNIYGITDFKTDISYNNRVSIEALILDTNNIDKIKKNINNKIISGIYAKIPDEIDYMNVRIKPHSVIDKNMISDAINGLIVVDDITSVIEQLSGFEYIKLYGNYHIWKKKI
jgi:hypothetical protein